MENGEYNELFPLTQDTPDIGRIVLEETNLKDKETNEENNNALMSNI